MSYITRAILNAYMAELDRIRSAAYALAEMGAPAAAGVLEALPRPPALGELGRDDAGVRNYMSDPEGLGNRNLWSAFGATLVPDDDIATPSGTDRAMRASPTGKARAFLTVSCQFNSFSGLFEGIPARGYINYLNFGPLLPASQLELAFDNPVGLPGAGQAIVAGERLTYAGFHSGTTPENQDVVYLDGVVGGTPGRWLGSTVPVTLEQVVGWWYAFVRADQPFRVSLVQDTFGASFGSVFPVAYERSNLVVNPSFELDTTGWVVDNRCTLAVSASQSKVGGSSLEQTTSTTGGGANSVRARTPTGILGMPVTAGQPYYAEARVFSALAARKGRLSVVWYSAAGALLSTSATADITLPTAAWTTLTLSATAPATAAFATILLGHDGIGSTGQTVLWDAIMLVQSATPVDYFDGSEPDATWAPIANLVTNPRFRVDAAGWSHQETAPGTGSVAAVPDPVFGDPGGDNAATGLPAGGAAYLIYAANTGPQTVVPGQTAAVFTTAMVKAAAAAAQSIKLSARFYTSAGAFISETDVATQASPVVGTFYELKGTAVAPATAAYVGLGVRVVANASTGGAYTLRVIQAMIAIANAVPDYFEIGLSPGPPHRSSSRQGVRVVDVVDSAQSGWVLVGGPAALQAGAIYRIEISTRGPVEAGSGDLWMTGATLVAGPPIHPPQVPADFADLDPRGPFNGSMEAEDDFGYAWSGAAHGSPSVRIPREVDMLALREREAGVDAVAVDLSVDQRRTFLVARRKARNHGSGEGFVTLIGDLIRTEDPSFQDTSIRVIEDYASGSMNVVIGYSPTGLMRDRVVRLIGEIKPSGLGFDENSITWGTFRAGISKAGDAV